MIMKDRRTLFARVTHPCGVSVEIMHIDELGFRSLFNITKYEVIEGDWKRAEVYKWLSYHKKKFGAKVELAFGCRKYEYINVHTGKREKLWGT